MRLLIGALIAGIIVGAVVTVFEKSRTEDRPCNALGDVQYAGFTRYTCQRTLLNDLRWRKA